MTNVLTAHARKRMHERLNFLTSEALDEILKKIEHQRPEAKLPRWADPWQKHNHHVHGMIRIKVWEPHPRRANWQRERIVGFPVVLRDERYELTTCLIGPQTGNEKINTQVIRR